MSREGVLYPRSYLRCLLRYRFMYVDRLERLEELVKHEPAQAKAEIAKHLDGELGVRPLLGTGSERRAEIRGRAVKWLRGLDMQNATRPR